MGLSFPPDSFTIQGVFSITKAQVTLCKVHKNSNSQKTRTCIVIMSSIYDRDTILMKFKQYTHLKKTCTRAIPGNKPTWFGGLSQVPTNR